ncbi:hypothetical protein INT45_008864 [Circinella minor]|uniref:Uncharacterized protein n=1 Tax=Circinella minor TaxID=1195481 RepID=A0A8H7VAQ7_9FUNG|nr:hypothetical protein INT45_008864 [Circinella minor]
MKDRVSTNMYNVNFHYLRHIHDICLKLGLLQSYSTRSAERAIGFFKKHIKQRVLPWSNAANIIKRHLITRAYHCMYVEEEVVEEVEEVEEEEEEDGNDQYTIPNGNQELELWDWHYAMLDMYSNKYNLFRYLQKYWHNQFNDSRVLTSTLDTRIRVGKWLFKTDTVFRCKEYPGMAHKLDTLVKLRLPTRGRSNSTAFYFGELILFFTHSYQGNERQLCLVKLYGNLQMTKYGLGVRTKYGTPYGHRTNTNTSESDKFIVTGCENILGYAGLIKSSLHPGHYYVIYPDMIPGDITLGNIRNV